MHREKHILLSDTHTVPVKAVMKCKAQFHFRASMRHAVSIGAHVVYDGRQVLLNLMSQFKKSVDGLTVSVVRARREWYGAASDSGSRQTLRKAN